MNSEKVVMKMNDFIVDAKLCEQTCGIVVLKQFVLMNANQLIKQFVFVKKDIEKMQLEQMYFEAQCQPKCEVGDRLPNPFCDST